MLCRSVQQSSLQITNNDIKIHVTNLCQCTSKGIEKKIKTLLKKQNDNINDKIKCVYRM